VVLRINSWLPWNYIFPVSSGQMLSSRTRSIVASALIVTLYCSASHELLGLRNVFYRPTAYSPLQTRSPIRFLITHSSAVAAALPAPAAQQFRGC